MTAAFDTAAINTAVRDAVAEFEDLHGRKPVVLKDMDNTDYDWTGRFNEVLLDLDPSFPVVPNGERVNYSHFALHDDYNPEILHQALTHPDLYHDMPLMPGAVESTHAFLDAGCPVFHVTMPALNNPGCVAGKVADLTRDYGTERLSWLVLTADKTIVDGDVLFDDKPGITGIRTPQWQHVLFDQDFNRYLDHPHRMHGWGDLARFVRTALSLDTPEERAA